MYKTSVCTLVKGDTQWMTVQKQQNHKKMISLNVTSPNCQCAVEKYYYSTTAAGIILPTSINICNSSSQSKQQAA